jgi:hypothetical protein
MDEKITANPEGNVSNCDAAASQEAIEDRRASWEQETSGGALSVRPSTERKTLLAVLAAHQCFLLTQSFFSVTVLVGSRCNYICILA